METNELIQQLASAIHHWLSYISICTNSRLLAESSVRYPFVEFLERKCGTPVDLEKQHDSFSNRHVDFCFNNEETKLYVELKYVSRHTRGNNEMQRVFNDLIRLSLLTKKGDGTRGFFIMCGDTESYNTNFRRIIDGKKLDKNSLPQYQKETAQIEPLGIYSEWFGFNMNEEKTIDLKSNEKTSVFVQEYYGDNATLDVLEFSTIKTKRIAFLPTEKQESRSQTVSIWEVFVVC